ncbi:MAG: hypothetical protein E7485_03670 [Ruminococcaceae bacterium]|nr:hypothetical protein [Oscillospiraceae bacterium]
MKKSIFCALLCGCLLLSGCGGDTQSDTASAQGSSGASVDTDSGAASSDGGDVSQESSQTAAQTTDTKPQQTESVPAESTSQTESSDVEATDTYAEMMKLYDNSYLGLPRADATYVFSSTGASAEINGELCYCVSCSEEHDGELYYMCDFYITENGTAVYRYYLAEEQYVLLPENKGFLQMDPEVQTPDEIFAVANELYAYFDLCALDGIPECTLDVEIDGFTHVYNMVADERLDTKPELLNALSCYFSSDIINSLMDSSQYREGPDGMLYSAGGARGSNIYYIDTTYELTQLTVDTAVFTAYSTYSDEITDSVHTEEYVYNAVKQDGRWVFTNFDLPY